MKTAKPPAGSGGQFKERRQMQVLSKFDPALDSVYGGGSTETTTTTNTNTCNGPTKTISINFGPVGIAYTNCKAPAAPSTPASGSSCGATGAGAAAPPPKSSDDNEDGKVRH